MIKRIRLLAVLLYVLLLLTACSQPAQPLEPTVAETSAEPTHEIIAQPTQTASPEPSAEPTQEQGSAQGPFSADYELLWETLKSDYPYLPYLREKGVDVDAVYETYRKHAGEAADANEFAKVVSDVFSSLKNTGHLYLLELEMFSDMYGYYVLSSEFEEGSAWRDIMVQAAEIGYYSVPESYDEDSSAYGYMPKVTFTYYDKYDTLIFAIPSFYTTIVDRDAGLIEETIAQYPEAKNIVFDITRNSGGDIRYWQMNIVAPFGEDQLHIWRMFYRSTPYNDRIAGEFAETHSVSEAESLPEWVNGSGLDRYINMEQTIPGRDAIHTDAKRWVLVDGNVYSASDQFVSFCKATGWATVVGKQTHGDGLSYEPALQILPDSGLVFRFCFAAGENPDGTMNIEGTAPDIVLDTANAAGVLRLIKEEQGY